MEKIERDMLIIKFLLEMNKKLDGMYMEEITEPDHPRPLIKFEVKLTCIYAQPCMFAPSDAFYNLLEECMKKYFKISAYDKLTYNNTNTVFWIYSGDLCG